MIRRLFQKDALTAAREWLGSEETDPTPAGSLHLSGYPCASLNLPAPCDRAGAQTGSPRALCQGTSSQPHHQHGTQVPLAA